MLKLKLIQLLIFFYSYFLKLKIKIIFCSYNFSCLLHVLLQFLHKIFFQINYVNNTNILFFYHLELLL